MRKSDILLDFDNLPKYFVKEAGDRDEDHK